MRHEVLGELRPDGDSGDVTATIRYEARQITVRIIPDGESIESTIRLAVELVSRLPEVDAAAKQIAVRGLCGTYNDGWREFDEVQEDGTLTSVTTPILSETEFAEKLSLGDINVTGTEVIELFYDNDDMFWGHSVVVSSLHALDFSDAQADLFG